VILHDAALSNDERSYGPINLSDHVIAVAMLPALFIESWDDARFDRLDSSLTLNGAVEEAIADAWGVPLPKTLHLIVEEVCVGARDGKEVRLAGYVHRRPPAAPASD
jgi:hypothetical protein